MESSIPTAIAETIQTAHINRAPSPRHDLNPSTAASKKEPVILKEIKTGDHESIDGEEDDVPFSEIRPKPRSGNFPPLPDLRFEQSYLHSIANADTYWKVAWITGRDQVMMPLAQGVLYNLFLLGWQHWNRNARVHGNSIGAKIRRWWYGVNNWELPRQNRTRAKKEL